MNTSMGASRALYMSKNAKGDACASNTIMEYMCKMA